MAYQNNIPQPNDKLRISQADIQENFNRIDAWVQVDHVQFDAADEGKHNSSTYVEQNSNLSFDTNEIGVFNAVPDTIGTLSGLTSNELHARKASGSSIPFTASGNGWTYLPSGYIMKFGKKQVTGNERIDFPSGSGIPAFTSAPEVTLSVAMATSGGNPIVTTGVNYTGISLSSVTVNVFNTSNGNDLTSTVRFIVIGK